MGFEPERDHILRIFSKKLILAFSIIQLVCCGLAVITEVIYFTLLNNYYALKYIHFLSYEKEKVECVPLAPDFHYSITSQVIGLLQFRVFDISFESEFWNPSFDTPEIWVRTQVLKSWVWESSFAAEHQTAITEK